MYFFLQLKYWIKDQKEEDAVYYLSRSTNPWSLIVGLMPDTYYFVKVMAFNAAGEGPESERFIGLYIFIKVMLNFQLVLSLFIIFFLWCFFLDREDIQKSTPETSIISSYFWYQPIHSQCYLAICCS